MDLQDSKHLNLLLKHRSVLINMEDIQWMNTENESCLTAVLQ